MPRLKKQNPEFHAVGRLLRGYGANGLALSKVLACAPGTARKKLKEPKYFTLGDIAKAARHYGISIDEVREAMVRREDFHGL